METGRASDILFTMSINLGSDPSLVCYVRRPRIRLLHSLLCKNTQDNTSPLHSKKTYDQTPPLHCKQLDPSSYCNGRRPRIRPLLCKCKQAYGQTSPVQCKQTFSQTPPLRCKHTLELTTPLQCKHHRIKSLLSNANRPENRPLVCNSSRPQIRPSNKFRLRSDPFSFTQVQLRSDLLQSFQIHAIILMGEHLLFSVCLCVRRNGNDRVSTTTTTQSASVILKFYKTFCEHMSSIQMVSAVTSYS